MGRIRNMTRVLERGVTNGRVRDNTSIEGAGNEKLFEHIRDQMEY